MFPDMGLEEIGNLSQEEVDICKDAYNRLMVDRMFIASYQAFQSVRANATNRKGELVNTKFNDLFDYDAEIKRLQYTETEEDKRKKARARKLRKLIAKANE